MAVRGGKVTYQMLFEPPIDPRRALYDGFAPDSADLERQTGLGLRNRDQLRGVMDGLAGRGTLWTVTDAHSRDYRTTDSLSAERYFVQQFWAAHPGVTVRKRRPAARFPDGGQESGGDRARSGRRWTSRPWVSSPR